MRSLVFLLIVVIFFSSSIPISFASSQPQIVAVFRTPTQPPPNYSVDVTCSILSRYGLVNVSFAFSINNGTFSATEMKIIDGDFYNGTFQAEIPPQPDETWVEYYVTAVDSIGYIAQSLSCGYEVRCDRTPPTILEMSKVKPIGSPVLPTEEVEVEALISDGGSGVRNATLFFGVGEDPYEMVFDETPMTKTIGGDYHCTFSGTLPPFANGSLIWYFVGATDNANNTVHSSERNRYSVTEAPDSWLTIESINILSVDMSNLTATVNITLHALLPSEDEPDSFWVHVSNRNGRYDVGPMLILPVSSYPEAQRFFYRKEFKWNVHLIGSPNNYPYDSYFLNFTFEVYWSNPDSINVGGVFFGDYRLVDVWGRSPRSEDYNTTDADGKPLIVTTIVLERSSANTLPIVLLILTLFFVLGGTMLVEPTSALKERVTVFLAILVFVAGFFFSLRSIVPYRHGFTVAEILILSLVIGSALFTVGSFLSNTIFAHITSRSIGVVIDFAVLLLFVWISGTLETPIPIEHKFLVVFGICYGLVIRSIFKLFMTARRDQQRVRYPRHWAFYE